MWYRWWKFTIYIYTIYTFWKKSFCLNFSSTFFLQFLFIFPHPPLPTSHLRHPTSGLTRRQPFLINNGRCPQLIIPANRLLYNMRSTSDRLLYNMWSDLGRPQRGEGWQPIHYGCNQFSVGAARWRGEGYSVALIETYMDTLVLFLSLTHTYTHMYTLPVRIG